MKRVFFSAIALVLILGSSLSVSKGSCLNGDSASECACSTVEEKAEKSEKCSYGSDHDGDIVEIMAFYGADRCSTCQAIERLTREVVERNFQDAVKLGRLRMTTIDITTTGGRSIAEKYDVVGSSLYINQWCDGREQSRNNMTSLGFSKAKSNPSDFKVNIKNKLELLLS